MTCSNSLICKKTSELTVYSNKPSKSNRSRQKKTSNQIFSKFSHSFDLLLLLNTVYINDLLKSNDSHESVSLSNKNPILFQTHWSASTSKYRAYINKLLKSKKLSQSIQSSSQSIWLLQNSSDLLLISRKTVYMIVLLKSKKLETHRISKTSERQISRANFLSQN